LIKSKIGALLAVINEIQRHRDWEKNFLMYLGSCQKQNSGKRCKFAYHRQIRLSIEVEQCEWLLLIKINQ